MRVLSILVAFLLGLAFLYVALVAVTIHAIPHVLSWSNPEKGALFLTADAVILASITWLYRKLPHRPRSVLFSLLEKSPLN